MNVKYKMVLEIEISQDIHTLENLKGSHELAQDVCELICDEATQTNSVVKYDILASEINVCNNSCSEWKKKFLQKFQKTC